MGKSSKLPGSQTPQAIKAFRLQSSAYGGVVPLIYGEARVAGNIIVGWQFESEVVTGGLGSISSGKAAGGLGAFKQYKYHIAVVLALGEGGPSIANLLWGTPDNFDVGLATPGQQAISVNNGGKKKIQPLEGIEPAGWKAKVVLVFGEKNQKSGTFVWQHAAWRFFATSDPDGSGPLRGRFISSPGDSPLDALDDGTPAEATYASDFGEKYKGTAYLVAQKLALGSNAGMPNWNVPGRILCVSGDVYGASGFTPNDGGIAGVRDADPPVIWLDIEANPKHGVGFWDGVLAAGNGGLMDALPDWPHPWGAGCTASTTPAISDMADSWSAWCRATDTQISLVLDTQTPAADVLKTLAEETQTAVVFSEGLLKMIPYADVAVTSGRTGVTYTPTNDPTATTNGANIAPRYDLTLDDFLPGQNKDPVEIERKSVVPDHGSAGLFNDIRVEFQHRMNGYSTEVAQAKDDASIAAVGLLSAPTFTYHEITDPNLALDTAERHLQRLGTVRNVIRFTLPWRFSRLEPMDVVTYPGEALAVPLTGQRFGVRITQTSKDKNRAIAVEAEEFPKAFASRAPEATPTPPSALDDDFLVIPWCEGIDTTDAGNPRYLSPWSDQQSYPNDYNSRGVPIQASVLWPPDTDHTLVTLQAQLRWADWQGGASPKDARVEIRVNVDGVTLVGATDPLLSFDLHLTPTSATAHPYVNQTTEFGDVKTWRGSCVIPAGALVVLEIVTLGIGGELIDPDVVSVPWTSFGGHLELEAG